jgi:hypothetical protein
MTLHEDVFTTVAAIEAVDAKDDQAIVDELIARGYDALRAELLAVFVPMGLARAVIDRLVVDSPIRWSDEAIVCYRSEGRELPLKLAAVPEFQTARHVGDENFASGVISRDLFSTVVSFSVELKLINRMLDAGEDIGGAVIEPPHLLRLSDAPGFDDWYQKTLAML